MTVIKASLEASPATDQLLAAAVAGATTVNAVVSGAPVDVVVAR